MNRKIKTLLVMLIFTTFIFSTLAEEDEVTVCTDSDDGENFYVRGTVNGLEAPDVRDSWTDYCGVAGEEEGKLVEYICGSDDYGQKVLYSCPNGCKDGACIEKISENCYSNKDCSANQFCEFDKCSAETGTCIDIPNICPTVYAPVCGCDGKTYSNDCSRKIAKVSKAYDGKCKTSKCAKEGEYTSGAVSPDYYFGCCEGLEGFDTHPSGWVGGGLLCYNPKKGTPVCKAVGTKSEGWYYPSGELLRYESCGSDKEFTLEVKTDKTQYQIGETVRITASVSGDSSSGIENAKVTATLSGPGQEEIAHFIDLKQVSCATTTCECPIIQCVKAPCPQPECPPCESTTICNFEGSYNPKYEGGYKITVTAKLKNMVGTDYTKFDVVSSIPPGIYVRLDEKFSLTKGQSAKVTDYDYMKITLNEIGEECTTSYPSKCYYTVHGSVGMPYNIKSVCDEKTGICGEAYAITGTSFTLREGESKEVFGTELTFLNVIMNMEAGKEYASFIVEKQVSEGDVEVEIRPTEQTITYGEKAVYEVTVTDKHPKPTCPEGTVCELTPLSYSKYTYNIHIKNLPFSKVYPKEIQVSPGGSKSFELIIHPYGVVEEGQIEVKEGTIIATGKAVDTTTSKISKVVKPVKKVEIQVSEEAVESIAASESEEEPTVVEQEEPIVIIPITNLIKRYKFSVTAKLKENYKVQDTAHAMLAIKPLLPPRPPPFPGEKISIKLYKGWNLISLPGKLIKFDKESLAGREKLIGFVYIKEEQRYVTLNEAEKILGNKLNEYLAKNAFWIYSRNPFTLNIFVDREISFQDLELVKGWNLVPITEDMVGGYLVDILGDCDLGKIYLWDAKNQKWEKISLKYSFSNYQIGYGFLAKAENYCRLVGPDIISPPSMPEE